MYFDAKLLAVCHLSASFSSQFYNTAVKNEILINHFASVYKKSFSCVSNKLLLVSCGIIKQTACRT